MRFEDCIEDCIFLYRTYCLWIECFHSENKNTRTYGDSSILIVWNTWNDSGRKECNRIVNGKLQF